ncbi:hypothetical protein BK648_25525 [Pseudomonas poae]|uniref:Uncharacterized protein n=1 Tax=Pseudomonas poae TaxID=200451 RepID=A0A423ES22_9PSED|nr:hypothetical protein BK648_25525 [Pseudomonas poae]
MIGFMAMAVAALVTDALTTAIRAFAMGQIQYLIHRFFFERVDGRCAHLGSQLQAIRVIVESPCRR